MKDNFDNVLDNFIKPYEGGYVNDKRDPGGETKYGISKRSYPSVNIATLTWEDAKKIYRRDFWDKIKGDELPPGLDLVTMDPAVNSGVKRGVQWLQKGLGVMPDGRMGPVTLSTTKWVDPVEVIQKACAARLGFMHGLRIWTVYGRGWSARVASVQAGALKMVGANLTTMAEAAHKKAILSVHKATAVGVAGSGTAMLDVSTTNHWLLVLTAVVTAVKYIGDQFHQITIINAYAEEATK